MRYLIALAALTIATATHAAPAPQPVPLLKTLGWMHGVWSETKDGVVTRESWYANGSGLAGLTETIRPGKPVQLERTTITAEPAGITFTAILPGQPPTPFVLRPGKEKEAVFENKAHDFPQRVIYRRCGADLCARVEGTIRGKFQFQEWRYRFVRLFP